ncbi:MAG: hypothetical protein IPF95_00010 [Flavobacteriales bacterium]|nr:hypothetical protein [Flavobacteriales bacterium]MBK6946338.1 hypothetical protein [Flavobacteriales bacterium]MBK7297723.1 hypothetical protein [Flavobacteriales bacterium]MBK9536387.1 hypothetical protein [Flavobacteriales bacterium]HQV50637.1 hypothetical protein [Flavobacteriales bacterium]
MTLYNSSGGASLAFNDDFCGLRSQITWTATFTGTVHVLVDRWTGGNACAHTGGCATVSITCNVPITNDDCSGAIDLPVTASCVPENFSNLLATASGTSPAPTCSSAPNTDVWFRFTIPASGVVRILSSSGSLSDGAMQLYSGTCGSLSLVTGGCDDDSGPGYMPYLDRRCAVLTPNTTYYLRYWGYGGATGTFDLCVYWPGYFPEPVEDCTGGRTICGSHSVSNATDYTGCTVDLNGSNRGCLASNERQGTWFHFSPNNTGTMEFLLQPTNGAGSPVDMDYDFAIWGPTTSLSCPPSGSPIRCSWAYPPNVPGYPGNVAYRTGLASGNDDLSETDGGAFVNGFVQPITVAATDVGKVYAMYVDNFDISGQTFDLTWTFSTPGMLDCTVLPVELVDFEAKVVDEVIELSWITQTESNSSHFTLEHSVDATDFKPIGSLSAAGNSFGTIDYSFDDPDPNNGVNYYRLKQVDLDGTFTYTDIVPIEFKKSLATLVPRPNPASSSIQIDLPESSAGSCMATIYDTGGRIVRSVSIPAWIGPSFVNIPLNDLEVGSYMIQLIGNDQMLAGRGRFIKE